MDPYLWLTDPDSDPAPDPAIFVSSDGNYKKKFLCFCFLLFETIFTSFFKDKK